jgi:putative selenate reductase molybdopterin-binding subunit
MLDVVGKRVPQVNGMEKVTGSAVFTTDMTLPHMLYAKTLKSPCAHAVIVKINADKALKLPGVVTVITGADIPNNERAIGNNDINILTTGKVRFIGDEIAAVAAVDEATAEKALELIEVEYEPLPAIFNIEDALKPGAPPIHDYEAPPRQVIAGDVEDGFKEADYIVEETFKTQPIEQAPLETEAVIAHWDGLNMAVWAGTQVPYWDRIVLSRTFEIPVNRIRVIVPFEGGAFGGKNLYRLLYICAALSWKTRRPVKIVRNREEEFTCSTNRNAYNFHMKFGVKKDGRLTAMSCDTIIDAGAYLSWAYSLGQAQGHLFASLYKCPNIKYVYRAIFTNNTYGGPMRGFGNAEINFAVESMMNIIAKKLEIDPIDLRLKNAVESSYLTAIGWKIGGCALRECIQKASEEIKKGFTPSNDPKKAKGIGLACGVHWCGWRVGFAASVWRTGYPSEQELYKANPKSPFIKVQDGKVRWRPGFLNTPAIDSDTSSCILIVNEDGTVVLHVAEPDIGQGSYTALAMIAAEELGIKLEDVKVIGADTNSGVFGFGSYASRVLFIAGRAVQNAAKEAKRGLAELASTYLKVDSGELEFKNRKIFVRTKPDQFMWLADAAFRAYATRGGGLLAFTGYCDPASIVPDPMGHGSIAEAYAFIAQGVEIEVNKETGELKVLRVVSCHDSGRIINPLAAEGQVEGAVVQGLGYALSEVLVRRGGRILNPNFTNYNILTFSNIPEIKVVFIEKEEPAGPFGAKGLGEPAIVCIPAALANALDNALGIRVKELPMTNERLFAEIKKHKT